MAQAEKSAPQQQERGPGPGRPSQPPRGQGPWRDRKPPGIQAKDRNVIFIGNKPPMNYVLAVVTQFNGGNDEVIIKARGKAISQAVDVAEIVRNKFFSKAAVRHVGISTDNVMSDDGRRRAVSAIEIRLENTEAKAGGAAKPTLPQQGSPISGPMEPGVPDKSAGA